MSNELSGFPTLKPAIITKVDIKDVHDLGKSAPLFGRRKNPSHLSKRNYPQWFQAYTLCESINAGVEAKKWQATC